MKKIKADDYFSNSLFELVKCGKDILIKKPIHNFKLLYIQTSMIMI
ncbi:hypothetical protein [Tissierella praeacuta]